MTELKGKERERICLENIYCPGRQHLDDGNAALTLPHSIKYIICEAQVSFRLE